MTLWKRLAKNGRAMQILNDGLPEPVYQWVLAASKVYDRGKADISVTELINPPRIRILKKKYWLSLKVKASSLLNVTLGQTVHKAIQDATKTGASERRLSIMVRDWVVSGGMDHYENGILSDWKTTNKWKTLYAEEGLIEEFEKQLNVYAQILREHKIPVTNAKIWAYFKDWNRGDLKRYMRLGEIFVPGLKQGYPEKEWLYFDLRLWDEAEAKAYLEERVRLHQEAESLLPECPKEELWSGRRCKDYCDVGMNGFCEQFNQGRT